MHVLKLVAAMAVAFLSTGCAAVFDGTSDEVTFHSIPAGARVMADGQEGLTPCTLEISKKVTTATFSLDGHEDREVQWERSFGFGWLLMDVLFTPGFGLSGILVDGISAGWLSHPGVVTCDFTEPEDPPGETEPGTEPER